MRDKIGYREQIERIAEIYPNRVTLTLTEAANVLGIDKRTLTVMIEKKKLVAIGSKGSSFIGCSVGVQAFPQLSAQSLERPVAYAGSDLGDKFHYTLFGVYFAVT